MVLAVNDEILATLARIERNYPITIVPDDDLIHVDVEGLHGDFRFSISPSTCAVFTESWHEHFNDSPVDLEALLKGLFSGETQIVVKYRGNTPVAHRTMIIKDDGPSYTSWTGNLVSPFWKKKSYKTFRYEAAKKQKKGNTS